MKRLAFAVVAGSFVAGASLMADEPLLPSIPQQLHQTGAFERVVVSEYEPLELSDLVGRSELIVEATTPGGRASLTTGDTDIYTDYPFEVLTIIKKPPVSELHEGHVIAVRRASGTLVIDGQVAVSQENDFPQFERGEHYFLFLARPVKDGPYAVVAGPQGVFTVRERVQQLSVQFGNWTTKRGAVTRAAFLDELRALLRFSS